MQSLKTNNKTDNSTDLSTQKWVWMALVKSALIPLVLVEMVLITVYLISNTSIREANIELLRKEADRELINFSSIEAKTISEQLISISSLSEIFCKETTLVFSTAAPPLYPDPLEKYNLSYNDTGVLYSIKDEGGAASFYSNHTPKSSHDLNKVLRLTRLDSLMSAMHQASPLISAIYFNSWDSYNHIFPWFLTIDQFPHDMNIPEYNFYYEANLTNNPTKNTVWTDVYIDPAGQGWMISAISPVYRNDFLEGVTGIDVTVQTIIDQLLAVAVPWNGYSVLVNENGTIMAMPSQGEHDFGLKELTEHRYEEAIRHENFKPDHFNIYKRQDTKEIAAELKKQNFGKGKLFLAGKSQLIAWQTIPETGWKLLTIVDESSIYEHANTLAARFTRLGYWMIAGLILFYLLFFAYMWRRSIKMSHNISAPLEQMRDKVTNIGLGHFRQNLPHFKLTELQETGKAVIDMGHRLERTTNDLLLSETRLQLALESSTDSLWEYNVETEQLTLDDFILQHIHPSIGATNKIHSALFNSLVHPDDLPILMQSWKLFLDGEEDQFHCEFRVKSTAGEWVWLSSHGKSINWSEEKSISKVIGTFADITERKQFEITLKQSMLNAESANIAKSQFLTSMSHELRTPLTSIIGFSQLLHNYGSKLTDEERKSYIEEVLKSSDHLLNLIDDVLDLSRIDASEITISIENLEITKLIDEACSMLEPSAQSQQVKLIPDWDHKKYWVDADYTRLRQVIINLLSNAIKYNVQGGYVLINAHADDKKLRINVIDQGRGIAKEQLSDLFKPFNRLGHEGSNIKGTGIGLTICKNLMEQMGGQIGYQEKETQGAHFWIELPLALNTPQQEVVRSLDQQNNSLRFEPKNHSIKILYVEDMDSNITLIEKLFCSHPEFELHIAKSAFSAIHLTSQIAPQLILMDINLSDMNGFKLLQALKKEPSSANIPVVALTADASKEQRQKGLEAGFDAYLTKPINVALTFKTIGQILGLQASKPQTYPDDQAH